MSEEQKGAAVNLDQPFRLGAYNVDPTTGEVRNSEQVVKLQPQAVDVLRFLAMRPGEVVSRSDIEEAVWSDRTVGYDALTGTMFKLRKALGDDPKSPKVIETISKRGYRLLVSPEPVPTETLGNTGGLEQLVPGQVNVAQLKRPASVVAIAVLAAVVLAAGWFASFKLISTPAGMPQRTDRVVVVLPFDNLSGAENGSYVANGLTEDLTTAVAKVPELTVIARDSAAVYKGERPSISEIAQRLKANFVVRGSVRHQGEHVRINIQLIDVSNGKHIWAEQLDGQLSGIFDLQDQIVGKLLSNLTGRAVAGGAPKKHVARTKNTKAYRAFQLGRQHFYLYVNKRENANARELFKEALRHDPQFAMAHAMLAWTYAFDATNGWTSDRKASLDAAFDEARKAKALSKDLPLPYFIAGLVHRERGDYVKAMVEAEKAIANDPNYANGHVLLATLLYYAGRPEESVERLKRAMRLNPHHPFNYSFHLGQAYFTLERYEDAIAALQKGVTSNPASERLHIWLAASLAHAGKLDDAQWEAEQVKVLNPQFSVSAIEKAYPFKNNADLKRFVDGLRKAGLT